MSDRGAGLREELDLAVVDGTRLYAGGAKTSINGTPYPGSVTAFDPATGNVLWTRGLQGYVIPALTATMRKEAVAAVGGYARGLWLAQDYHLYLKLAAAGWRFAYVDRKLAQFRWPEPTRGRTFDRRLHELYELRMWAGFALRHPLTPGPRGQVWRRLRRELRRALSH